MNDCFSVDTEIQAGMVACQPSSRVADVSHCTMEAAIFDGTATYLGDNIHDFIRFRSNWWMRDFDVWFQVTRPDLAIGLDLMAKNIQMAVLVAGLSLVPTRASCS